MPRGIPELKALESGATRATMNTMKEKESNLAPQCNEDFNLYSAQNPDDPLEWTYQEAETVAKMPATPQHSVELFHCCNVAAHQDGRHYVCKICASLANTYLRKTNALLDGRPPYRPPGRFFPLCINCAVAAQASGNQGCSCDYLDQALCFQCKRDSLEAAAARCKVELQSRSPRGERALDKELGFIVMKQVLKCVCGRYVEDGYREKEVLRCAGCEATVAKIGRRYYDPLNGIFVTYDRKWY